MDELASLKQMQQHIPNTSLFCGRRFDGLLGLFFWSGLETSAQTCFLTKSWYWANHRVRGDKNPDQMRRRTATVNEGHKREGGGGGGNTFVGVRGECDSTAHYSTAQRTARHTAEPADNLVLAVCCSVFTAFHIFA